MNERVFAVVGANLGDEGKGLAVDRLTTGKKALVIRHNGGAQAGHTVEHGERRFVFHQFSSGSLRGADTLWAETFLPDLFKLRAEAEQLKAAAGFLPAVHAEAGACVTLVDDVLINMALETARGEKRHGSCGMGINEAVLRREAGFPLELGRVKGMTCALLTAELGRIRREYSLPRARELGLIDGGEYAELLKNGAVLENAAEEMLRGAELIRLEDAPGKLLAGYERIVFEGAQGLLLDSENEANAPHVTASRTGLTNPAMLCEKYGETLDTAVYVLRSYVTRHGAGPLWLECEREALGALDPDLTNARNEWQGSLRYAPYRSPWELARRITADLAAGPDGTEAALFVTHLNETAGMIRFACGDIGPRELAAHPAFSGLVKKLYLSASRFSKEVEELAPPYPPAR